MMYIYGMCICNGRSWRGQRSNNGTPPNKHATLNKSAQARNAFERFAPAPGTDACLWLRRAGALGLRAMMHVPVHDTACAPTASG